MERWDRKGGFSPWTTVAENERVISSEVELEIEENADYDRGRAERKQKQSKSHWRLHSSTAMHRYRCHCKVRVVVVDTLLHFSTKLRMLLIITSAFILVRKSNHEN